MIKKTDEDITNNEFESNNDDNANAESLLVNLNEKENNIDNKEIEKKQNKQIGWAVFLMVGIILIIILVPFINNNFINKFNYNGIVFQKTQLGDLIFYSSKFPVVSATGQVMGDYAINLRNDPRDLEYIPLNTSNDKIEFTLDGDKYGDVYISLNPFMKVCEDSGIALLTLSGFLKDSSLNVKSAVTDKAYADVNNLTQRWCHDSGFDTVIIVTDGNETIINEIFPHCYEMKFKDCEILQVSEKFILTILEDYTNQFKKD